MHTTPPSLLMRVRDPADRSAWEEFDRRYRDWLIRYFRRKQVPFADAEDLAQRVLSNLSSSLARFSYDPNRGRFRDYLFRCARNALFEWGKCPARSRTTLVICDAVSQTHDDPANDPAWDEEWINHHYSRALEKLRRMATDRDIAILERSMAGVTVQALAREFEMEEAAVLKARQRIRARIEGLIATQVAEEDRIDD